MGNRCDKASALQQDPINRTKHMASRKRGGKRGRDEIDCKLHQVEEVKHTPNQTVNQTLSNERTTETNDDVQTISKTDANRSLVSVSTNNVVAQQQYYATIDSNPDGT